MSIYGHCPYCGTLNAWCNCAMPLANTGSAGMMNQPRKYGMNDLLNIAIIQDESMPKGSIVLRDEHGDVIGSIVNIGKQKRRIRDMVSDALIRLAKRIKR